MEISLEELHKVRDKRREINRRWAEAMRASGYEPIVLDRGTMIRCEQVAAAQGATVKYQHQKDIADEASSQRAEAACGRSAGRSSGHRTLG